MNRASMARIACRTGLRSVIGSLGRWSGVVAFNYHRIGDSSKSPFDRALWSANADTFSKQLRFFKSHLDPITPDDLPEVLNKRRGRYGLITFDDGYRDNYDTAFPLLQREGVKAAFFLTSGFIGTNTVPWWDEIAWMLRNSPREALQAPGWLASTVVYDEPARDAAIAAVMKAFRQVSADRSQLFLDAVGKATRSERCRSADLWMTWDMVRTMRAAGMVIGGHSVEHPVLGQADPDRQAREILGSIERVAQELREPVTSFSYPFGGRKAFNEVSVDMLRKAGVRYAFTYYGGYRRFDDWVDYDVRRIPVEAEVTYDWFRCLVTIPAIFAR